MKMKTFELVGCMITSQRNQCFVVVIYRPGSSAVSKQFFYELTTLLETLSSYITGDINIHLDQLKDTSNIKLQDILSTFGLVQHVRTATHTKGHTLDVFITRMDTMLAEVNVNLPGIVSEHAMLSCKVSFDKMRSNIVKHLEQCRLRSA